MSDQNDFLHCIGIGHSSSKELHEETGLYASGGSMRPLCLWESVFPTSSQACLEAGQVKGHAVTVFMEAVLDQERAQQLVLQASECD